MKVFQKQIVIALLGLAICLPGGATYGQSCNPAVVSYLMRDESGKLLDEAKLKAIYDGLPKSIGDAKTFIGEISMAADGTTFYWRESLDWSKGKNLSALQFINNESCTMRLTEVTLVYHNKTMRLIFNLEITRNQDDRRPVIDSLPFQEGTFMLQMKGWSADPNRVVPAARWKRVKD
jgi:hypothetical protein